MNVDKRRQSLRYHMLPGILLLQIKQIQTRLVVFENTGMWSHVASLFGLADYACKQVGFLMCALYDFHYDKPADIILGSS